MKKMIMLAVLCFSIAAMAMTQPNNSCFNFNLSINAPTGVSIVGTTATYGFAIKKTGPKSFSIYDNGSCNASEATAAVTVSDNIGGVSVVTLANKDSGKSTITALTVIKADNAGDLQFTGMSPTLPYVLSFGACKHPK